LIRYESLGADKKINKIIKNFIFNSKRFIGRDFDEDVVQLDIQKMPFEVVNSMENLVFKLNLKIKLNNFHQNIFQVRFFQK